MPSRMPATPRIASAHQLILIELPIDHSSYSRAREGRLSGRPPGTLSSSGDPSPRAVAYVTYASPRPPSLGPPEPQFPPKTARLKMLFGVGYRPLRGHLKARFDPLAKGVSAHRPGDPVTLDSMVHQHQGRDAADPKPLLEARFQIGIHLDRLHPSGEVG